MPTIKDIAPESVFTIELNAGTPGRQGPKGEPGIQGIQGPKGEPGPKPIRGIDYFTQQDISNMVTTITGNSNSAFNENVANKIKDFNANVSAKTSAFDNNAVLKTEEFNENANSKKTDFNLNANNRTTEFNTNASNKKNEIDTHVTNKTTEFDNHVVEKINEFKEETSEYVTETELNSKGYLVQNDLNGYAKEENLFSGSYNDLENKPKIPSKTSELTNDIGFINTIPSEYVTEEEQNEFIKPYNERITANEEYLDTITPKQTASGELVHITDALPLPTFENKIDGNVKQETTRGVNLIDKNNYIQDNNNVVGIDISNLVIGETYTFSSSVSITTMKISNVSTGHNSVTYEDYNGFKTHTFTMARNTNISEDTKQYLFIKINSTTWATDISQLGDLQIEPGDTATAPEKYTGGIASPNPDYPQPISVIEGSLKITICNNNLFDIEAFKNLSKYNVFETYNNVECLKLVGRPITLNVNCEKNTRYTFQFKYIGKTIADIGVFQFLYDDNTTSEIKYTGQMTTSGTIYSAISTVNKTVVGIKWNGWNAGASVYIDKNSMQLEKGTQVTPYEPYKEQIVPLDLKGNFVGAINDTIKDYLVTDKKKFWLVKNVGKGVLNGSENWTTNSGWNYTNTSAYILNQNPKTTKQVYSDKFFFYRNVHANDVNGEVGIVWENTLAFRISNTLASDVNGFKNWLSTHNTEVYYALAEPQIIDLGTLPEPIKTFEGVNNIQVLANLDTEIEVKYALDVKKYYDNKLAEISAQII